MRSQSVKLVRTLICAVAVGVALSVSTGCDSGADPISPHPAITATALPAVFRATVQPEGGPLGTEITVAGSGWGPGLPVSVTLSGAAFDAMPYAATQSDAAGNFIVKFRIERGPAGEDLKPGRLDLLVIGFKGNTVVPFQLFGQDRNSQS